MANGSGFVSSSSFNFPDEILKRLRSTSFLTGREPGPQFTKALVEGALNPLAELASSREAQGKQFALEKEGLDLQRQNVESLAAFREGEMALQNRRLDELRKQRKTDLFAGVGKLTGLAMFMPTGKTITTTKGGVTTTLTPTIGREIIEFFKRIF